IWGNKIRVPLGEMIEVAVGRLKPELTEKVKKELISFIFQRADNLLESEGVPVGIRRAVLNVEKEDLLSLRRKINALLEFLQQKDNQALLVGFTRVANILKQAKEKGLIPGEIDPVKLLETSELNLYRLLQDQSGWLNDLYREGNYLGFLQALRQWSGPIDRFFDEVLVMTSEKDLRDNRLGLLGKVNDIFLQMADFSEISPEELGHA
ncbi:MAG: DALR anticodon-binding domain-containing protein, partial [Candidatus Omnitrophica bacterium]|nr:DALR anticodon-binding domain-containing protein [Candidatus Omnitrophota bacterium]